MGEKVKIRYNGACYNLETEDDNSLYLKDVQALCPNATTLRYEDETGLSTLLRVRVSLSAFN